MTDRDEKRDSDQPEPAFDPVEATPTDEVGSEGGSPGDVEVETDRRSTGSEADTTIRPDGGTRRFSPKDVEGRRSP